MSGWKRHCAGWYVSRFGTVTREGHHEWRCQAATDDVVRRTCTSMLQAMRACERWTRAYESRRAKCAAAISARRTP